MFEKFYKVAEHVFAVAFDTEALFDDIHPLMTNYNPFAVNVGPAMFQMRIVEASPLEYEEETRQEDEGQVIVCGHLPNGNPVFEFGFSTTNGMRKAGVLICSKDYLSAELRVETVLRKTAVDNALMVLYALATARHNTVLFHGAVVSLDGKGYMFLGKSGTGKSTHARLWLKHIAETELVNDDNPVVRMQADGARIYGSPWSGKTPCYKNLAMPLGGVVLLSQAPYNKIARLGGIQAYAAIVPSISGKRWDSSVADGLHNTENKMAQTVPAFYLECLPDQAAAELCCKTIKA